MEGRGCRDKAQFPTRKDGGCPRAFMPDEPMLSLSRTVCLEQKKTKKILDIIKNFMKNPQGTGWNLITKLSQRSCATL